MKAPIHDMHLMEGRDERGEGHKEEELMKVGFGHGGVDAMHGFSFRQKWLGGCAV